MKMSRRQRFRRCFRPVLAGIAGPLALAIGAEAAHACRDEAMKRLDSLGVASNTVTDIWIYRESTQEGGLQGYKAWVSLKGCEGYAVIDMDNLCRPFQVYTTKDCRIPGVPNY